MLSTEAAQAASDLLFAHWRDGTTLPILPPALRPMTRAEGYAIQARLEGRSAKPLLGWKIAATSDHGQAHIGVDGPMAGRLLAEWAFEDGAARPLGANRMAVAEAEFAFRMARDLPPRPTPYREHEVLDAVATLHPAIELPDARYDDFAFVGAPLLIADNACAHEFVLGPATAAPWREIDLAQHRVVGRVAGPGAGPGVVRLEHEGSGEAVLGDPRNALTWLANELSGLGIALAAGQVVTTGTCLAPMAIRGGDQVSADFGVLGTVHMRLIE